MFHIFRYNAIKPPMRNKNLRIILKLEVKRENSIFRHCSEPIHIKNRCYNMLENITTN